MQKRLESATTHSDANAAMFANEVADSMSTVAALGRERETLRLFEMQTRAMPKRERYLILSSGGIATGQAIMFFSSALIYHWSSKRLADGAVSQNLQTPSSNADPYRKAHRQGVCDRRGSLHCRLSG
jgi:ATP-binding cassette subfamily B (MDR/TAP) protein 1